MILGLVPYSSRRQEEQGEPTAVIAKEDKVTHVTQDRRMFGGHFCGLDNFLALITVRHDSRGVLFLSRSIRVTEWSSLIQMFSETVCV